MILTSCATRPHPSIQQTAVKQEAPAAFGGYLVGVVEHVEAALLPERVDEYAPAPRQPLPKHLQVRRLAALLHHVGEELDRGVEPVELERALGVQEAGGARSQRSAAANCGQTEATSEGLHETE